MLVSSSYCRLFAYDVVASPRLLIGLLFTDVFVLLCSFLREAASIAWFVVVCTFLSKASISLISRSFFDKISYCLEGLLIVFAADYWC